MRLAHGYTNATAFVPGGVRKVHLGPDADRRHDRELVALRTLQELLPVPALLSHDETSLIVDYVPGRHGQELIEEGHGERVLRMCGQLARDLRSVDSSLLPELGSGAQGAVLVHGDFGPQNLIVDAEEWRVAALIDWEWAHLGSAVEDLAWAEWIVRTHHPREVRHLESLFEGYGERPPWKQRHEAMLDQANAALDFVGRWNDAEQVWLDRVSQTRDFRE